VNEFSISDNSSSISRSRSEQLFDGAVKLTDPSARRQYVERMCAENPLLRQELESLLAAHERAGTFLNCPAAQAAAVSRDAILVPNAVATPKAFMPRTFHDYELLEEIARGGMGVIFKARQLSLNRAVAVKMILAGHLAGENDIRRFRLEAEAAARLAHPNIVSIYEVGAHEGQPYFSMRYVEGRSLHRIVEDGIWKLGDCQAAAQLLAKVARAVHFAHERGIVHRDLKPGNILLDAQGEPHITDFGLARLVASDSSLTISGSVMGTPSFMAPEQAAGRFHRLTPAADLYSLGAVLYYLLTGRPPFFAETPLDILVQVLDREALQPRALNPKVPRELERICLRCLEKAPERRYRSAAALADDLERFLRGEPVDVPLCDTSSRVRQWVRREPALVARLIGLVICAVISQAAYELGRHGDLSQHIKVMTALGLWGVVSFLCYRGLARQRWANFARIAWSGADIGILTAVLQILDALESPLVAFYPALIACSGLWFRVALVRLTAQFCALGYIWLLIVEYSRTGTLQHAHWHFTFLIILALTGFIVAYHVHRLSILGRYCDSRSS